jgi:thiol-disulfide isomerase/thioredoxin
MMWMATRIFVFIALLSLTVSPGAMAQSATPPTEDGRPTCAVAPQDGTPGVQGTESELAAWQTLTMTDVRTGQDFAVSGFLGCTVYVETMATWCINCMMQMGNVAAALPDLDPERHVVISISIETELAPKDLAKYADKSGFDWIFSVASPELLKAIVDAFGRDAVVPSITPHVIVYPDGTAGDLQTGGSSPEEIIDMMNETGES